MTAYVIRLVSFASGRAIPQPSYLEHFDPDYGPPTYPNGEVKATAEIARAMLFNSFGEAMECIGRASTTVPVRPDGVPNKPLTMFDIAVEPVENAT